MKLSTALAIIAVGLTFSFAVFCYNWYLMVDTLHQLTNR